MIRKIAPTCVLCAVISLLTACGAAEAPTVPSSTVVTPPAPTTGIVQGIVKRAAFFGATFNPEAPFSGAQVLVTEGAGTGQSVTTGSDGAYRFELAPGPFRLRWSASSFFETRDSNPGVVVAGSTTTVDAVVLRFAEWSVSGIVRDGVGKPVAGAWVTVSGGLFTPIADATTDAAGRYRIVSTTQHADPIQVKAEIGGSSQFTIVTCGPACAITADFRLLRRVREWIDGPSAMQVGEVAEVTTVTEYDDGSRTTAAANPLESSNPAVVRVLPLEPPYQTTNVKAISPGTVTLRLAYSQPLLLNIRVAP